MMYLIILKAGLFSAIVTAFIIESYKFLQQDSGDVTVFYLRQVVQELVQLSNQTHITNQPSAPDDITDHAVSLNVLFVLSLMGSLACALGATLVQAWTSR